LEKEKSPAPLKITFTKRTGHSIFEVPLLTPQDASGLAVKSFTVRLGADKAEPDVVVPVRRSVVVTVR